MKSALIVCLGLAAGFAGVRVNQMHEAYARIEQANQTARVEDGAAAQRERLLESCLITAVRSGYAPDAATWCKR